MTSAPAKKMAARKMNPANLDPARELSGWTAAHLDLALYQALEGLRAAQAEDALPHQNPLELFRGSPLSALSQALGLSTTEQFALLLATIAEVHPLEFRHFAKHNYDEHAAPPLGCISRHLVLHLLRRQAGEHSPGKLSAESQLLRLEVLVRANPGSQQSLSTTALQLDSAILAYLYGDDLLHPQLASSAQKPTATPDARLQDGQQLEQLMTHLLPDMLSAAQLHGPDDSAQIDLALSALALLGRPIWQLSLNHFLSPQTSLERELLLWERESRLRPLAFILVTEPGDSEGQPPGTRQREKTIQNLAEQLQGPLVILTREPLNLGAARPMLLLEVPGLSRAEQRERWMAELNIVDSSLPGLRALTDQFHLSAKLVRERSQSALISASAQRGKNNSSNDVAKTASDADKLTHAWEACRVAGRQRLSGLAERLTSAPNWDDVVLPPEDKAVLRQITEQVRHRAQVYDDWGMGRGTRGLGISALFSGPSGTGKTLAAEVVAHDLQLDLYRVDVASMVSKYIGETEKNLRLIFDAADEGGVILLFDEADSLFGKRTDAQSSNDRFANTQVNYLLQRMESYRGLALLTTNLESGMDSAFMRRLRFTLNFKPPEAAEREIIWRRAFPQQIDVSRLDFTLLGKIKLSGGNIRSVALSAAFLAAARREGLSMTVLREAVMAEWRKLGRLSLDDAAFAGWPA